MDELSADRFEVHHAAPRGHRQAYLDEGDGPALLLVHGWPETMRIWWRNVQPLVDAGFRVVVPDLRGFGGSEMADDGYGDVAAHSRDLHALVDHLGIDRVVAVAGDLGGAVIQDLSARFEGLVGRMVLFNAPLPFLPDRMEGLRTRPAAEATDYFVRQGTDADALAAELDTPGKRRRYVATFYTSRFWAHPGGFSDEAVAFMSEPFGTGLRRTFTAYESALSEAARSEPPLLAENATPTLILYGPSDHVVAPDFDRMAAIVFPDHVGPFLLRDVGHFVQWEAADVLDGAIVAFCRDPD